MRRAAPLLAVLLLAGCIAPQVEAPAHERAAPVVVARGEAGGGGGLGQGYGELGVGAEPVVLAMRGRDEVFAATFFDIYRSADRGATWTLAADPRFPNMPFVDGIALAEDDAGALYAAAINGAIVSVARSLDGGRSWEPHGRVAQVDRVADRVWIAARGDGEVALVYNAGRGTACARSTDGGATWTQSLLGPTTPGLAGNLVFDGDGRLWYASNRTIHRHDVPCAGPSASLDLPAAGAQIFVQLDLDAQGRVYASYPSPDNAHMMLLGADAAMSPASVRVLAVSPPELRSNTFGSVTVAPSGDVAVLWYASRAAGAPDRDGFGGAWEAAAARVSGFWTEAPHVRHDVVDAGPLHAGPICMAGSQCTDKRWLQDYLMADHAPDGSLYAGYARHEGRSVSILVARLDP